MATTCSGDCMKCNIMQRQYCSAQIAYNNMRLIEQMSERINGLKSDLELLKKEGSQEESLINPLEV